MVKVIGGMMAGGTKPAAFYPMSARYGKRFPGTGVGTNGPSSAAPRAPEYYERVARAV